ncbi:GH43 family beta-xylosidase [Novosphingobium sp. PhB165]|uniref:glycoside hydrolase family 43 protein n=1 Tax=Novosphingobium sp. PhB165 TaxID=2485105 RepID=UPI00104BE193|nr:glycoside hydrolase family 43 protein [Novosphingobium sp. PhB165]TCM18902.1 GH43 family beta-xylosidase [Novosphingobium sp. PhB165]
MNFPLSRRAFAAGAAMLPMACTSAGKNALGSAPAATGAPVPVNPLVRQRADAQVFRHDDGYYYLTGSVPEYDRLVLRRSKTVAGLSTAEERVLWRHEASGPMSGFIWAPELHLIDGRWYMYFAAGPSGGGEDVFRIRTFAIVCDGPDPMTGNWKIAGQFQLPTDSFNLDSTSFVHRGTRYFAWAQREAGIDTNSNLYIAPMSGPLTLAAAPTRLSVPTLDWEIRGYKVNEAPAVIEHAGKLFMTYSASATDARYCLGLLSIDAEANLMDASLWTKSQHPVFTTNTATSVYGPGHNSFTVDEQGRPLLVYHGRDYEAIQGDPLFNPDRHTRVQRLYFDASGNPDFGVPVGNGAMPDRFISVARPGTYMAHEGTRMTSAAVPLPQTQFRVEDAGEGTVTLSPILLRDHCLVATADGSVSIAQRGTGPEKFRRTSAGGGAVRFVSVTDPSKSLAVAPDGLRLAPGKDAASAWKVD